MSYKFENFQIDNPIELDVSIELQDLNILNAYKSQNTKPLSI
jgi:hypothetical protein